jgi:hypothetical protein
MEGGDVVVPIESNGVAAGAQLGEGWMDRFVYVGGKSMVLLLYLLYSTYVLFTYSTIFTFFSRTPSAALALLETLSNADG